MIRKHKTAVTAGNLHYPNDEQMAPLLSDVDVTNNQLPMGLELPDEDVGGSLHYPNDEVEKPEVETKEKRNTIEASKRLKLARQLRAGHEDLEAGDVIDLPEPADDPDSVTPGDDPNATFGPDETGAPFHAALAKVLKKNLKVKAGKKPARKTKAATHEGGTVGEAEGEQNVSEICNEEDPAAGYLPIKEEREFILSETAHESENWKGKEEPGEIEEREAHEVDAFDFGAPSGEELEHGDNPQSILEANEGDDEDWDAPVEDELDEEEEEEEEPETFVDEEEEPLVDEVEEEEEPEEEVIEGETGDVMDVLDVDGTEDDADDIAFATIASANGKSETLHVIRGHRIIASMTKKAAVKAGVEDLYTTEAFASAVEAEVARNGLRAGLTGMGLTLAKVRVNGSKLVDKRVKAKALQLTASLRTQQANRQEALEQSFALAAVGMNRNFFKGYKNELKAALIDRLEEVGVRNAARLVASVFAEHGISHAKSLINLATRISAMPTANRNTFAEALDMTEDNPEHEEDFNEEPEEAADERIDDEFNEEFIDDIEAPETIEAALSRPATRLKASIESSIAGNNSRSALLNPSKVKLSAAAQAILDGKVSFGY